VLCNFYTLPRKNTKFFDILLTVAKLSKLKNSLFLAYLVYFVYVCDTGTQFRWRLRSVVPASGRVLPPTGRCCSNPGLILLWSARSSRRASTCCPRRVRTPASDQLSTVTHGSSPSGLLYFIFQLSRMKTLDRSTSVKAKSLIGFVPWWIISRQFKFWLEVLSPLSQKFPLSLKAKDSI